MKITIAFSCEHSSILISYIIDVEINCNYSLNLIISLEPIPYFYFFTRMLYIWKVIIAKTKMSDCGWSRNGSHKLSTNSNLNAFFDWTGTVNFYFFREFKQEFS